MNKIRYAGRLIFTVNIVTAILLSSVIAQNNIRLLRYDDNILHLKKDSLKKGFDQLKYMALGKYYFSLGGEIREQLQVTKNINFGDIPPSYLNSNSSQWNHRFMLHARIDLGDHIRIFTQLNNTLRFLNKNPVVPEIDENRLSLHQAFAEIKSKDWKFRLGRQELFYGVHRLFTVREGPNTRKSFDGLVLKRKLKNGMVDLLAIAPVVDKQYAFDDEHFKETVMGFYGTQYFDGHKIGLDYYALNFQSRHRRYNYQAGFENRHTLGLRLFSKLKKINFELETAYQAGSFSNLRISAYNILADINIIILPAKKGVLGIAANMVSGDRNTSDNKLHTWNLLFAKPAYGLAIPIGSANMNSVYPYLRIDPIQKLNLLAQVFLLARNSNQDGTYSPSMMQNRPNPEMLFSTKKKTLGVLYVVETTYQQSQNLSFAFDASYAKAGSYILATGKGKNITYISFKSTFRF